MADIDIIREEINRILKKLKKLESRVTKIESHLNNSGTQTDVDVTPAPLIPENFSEAADNLELRIGQFWFAKAGIVVLAIGIAFLLTFPYKNLPPFLPSLFGYLLVLVILSISYLWRNSFDFLSRYLLGGGLVLLYFATLRLHYFSEATVLASEGILTVCLLISVIISFYAAIRRKSIYLAGLATLLGYITIIISDQSYTIFILLLAMSSFIVFLKLKFHWKALVIYGIIFTYFTHFLWYVNNPLMGRPPQLLSSPVQNLLFILAYMIIFSLANYLRGKAEQENQYIVFSNLLNCLGGYGLYLLITISSYNSQLFIFQLIASILFLAISILFWIRERSKYSTFFYAILGYSALSTAILAQFDTPDSFIWLCWQSLLVISTALWFRSKIIVVANFMIFIIIFMASLALDKEMGVEGLSFGLVALLSARIMNWQKHRLELKTEFMRNSYLTTAFIMIPYSLYQIVPAGYVSLSWVAVALFYYMLNMILHNKKYRWMALFTLLLTVVYILIIGIAKLDPIYRIISFIVLGIVLLGLSIAYTKMKTKKDKK